MSDNDKENRPRQQMAEQNTKETNQKKQDLLKAQQQQRSGPLWKNGAKSTQRFNQIAKQISQQPGAIGGFQCQPSSSSSNQTSFTTQSNITIKAHASAHSCYFEFEPKTSTQHGRPVTLPTPSRLQQIKLLAEVMYAQEKANAPDDKNDFSLNINIKLYFPENPRLVHDYFLKYFSSVTINGQFFEKKRSKKKVKLDYEKVDEILKRIEEIDTDTKKSCTDKFSAIFDIIFPVPNKNQKLDELDQNTLDLAHTYLIKQWNQLLTASEKTATQKLIKQRQTIYNTTKIDPKRRQEITHWQGCTALDNVTGKTACPAGPNSPHPLFFYFSDKIDGAERVNHAFKQWLKGKDKKYHDLFTQQLRFARQDTTPEEKLNRQVYFTYEKELTCPGSNDFLKDSKPKDLVTAMENIATENNVTTKNGQYAIANEMHKHLKRITSATAEEGLYYGAFELARTTASEQLIKKLKGTTAVVTNDCKAIASYSPNAIIAILQPVYNKQDTVEKKAKFYEVLDEILKVGKNSHGLSEVNQEKIKQVFFNLMAVLKKINDALKALNTKLSDKSGNVATDETNNFIAACKPLKDYESFPSKVLTEDDKKLMKDIAQELIKLDDSHNSMSANYFFFSSLTNSEQKEAEQTLNDFLDKHRIIEIKPSN